MKDQSGRVCISKPGNSEVQCDDNVNGTIFSTYGSDFSLSGAGDGADGYLKWNGSATFFACPIDEGKEVWNVYTSLIDEACAEIVLGIEMVEDGCSAGQTSTVSSSSTREMGSKTMVTLTVPPGSANGVGSIGMSTSGSVSASASVSGMGGGEANGAKALGRSAGFGVWSVGGFAAVFVVGFQF